MKKILAIPPKRDRLFHFIIGKDIPKTNLLFYKNCLYFSDIRNAKQFTKDEEGGFSMNINKTASACSAPEIRSLIVKEIAQWHANEGANVILQDFRLNQKMGNLNCDLHKTLENKALLSGFMYPQ